MCVGGGEGGVFCVQFDVMWSQKATGANFTSLEDLYAARALRRGRCCCVHQRQKIKLNHFASLCLQTACGVARGGGAYCAPDAYAGRVRGSPQAL